MNQQELATLISVAGFTILTLLTLVCGVMAVHLNTLRNIKRFIVSVSGTLGVFGIAAIIGRLTVAPTATASGIVLRSDFPRFIDQDVSLWTITGAIWLTAVATLVGVLSAPRD